MKASVTRDHRQPERSRVQEERVLHGTLTASAPIAYLAGLDTLDELMKDRVLADFVRRAVFDEILPMIAMPEADKREYAESVLDDFRNPFVRHDLLSITPNSISKWRARVLPSLLDYRWSRGTVPPALAFSLAGLIAFYRGTVVTVTELEGRRGSRCYPIRDDPAALAFFAEVWPTAEVTGDWYALAYATLARDDFWGMDLNRLPGFAGTVAQEIAMIATSGADAAVASITTGQS